MDKVVNNKGRLISEKIIRIFGKNCSRVLLVNPPQVPEEDFDIEIALEKRYPCFPPYGLGILCNNLESRGYTTDILDLNFEVLAYANESEKSCSYNIWEDKLRDRIQSFKPDVVGLTCMFTMTHRQLKRVADFIKECQTNLPVVAGGVHVSSAANAVLKDCKSIDFVFMHEGDRSFADMLDFINGKIEADKLTQLVTSVDNTYLSTKEGFRPTGAILNVPPEYHELKIEKYSSFGKFGSFHWLLPEEVRASSVISSRGCRGRCTFCAVRVFYGQAVRQRDVVAVVDEIEALKSKYGISHIMWLDDDLLYNEKRAVSLFNEITRRNLGITWDTSNGVNASSITPEIAHSAVESGCIGLALGIESGNAEILRSTHKPVNSNNFRNAARILKNYPQVFVKGFLMIGFPNETFGQIMDTANLALELSLDWYPIQILTPFPSTTISNSLIEAGELDEDFTTGSARFYVGATGGQRLREEKEKIEAKEFANLFNSDLSAIPSKDELKDVWFLLDYKVNYEKILTEDNPIKLAMLQKMLRDVCDRMTKENALGNLFLAIIERKLGNAEGARKRALLAEEYLEGSDFWRKRFEVLDLYKLMI